MVNKSNHPLYVVYKNMLSRCFNANNPKYKSYGAKGITVCSRWKKSFDDFVSDMGPRPPGASLDRIDKSRDYCPENCRFVYPSIKQISLMGRSFSIGQWSEKLGISETTLRQRINRGWSDEKTLTLHPLSSRCEEYSLRIDGGEMDGRLSKKMSLKDGVQFFPVLEKELSQKGLGGKVRLVRHSGKLLVEVL